MCRYCMYVLPLYVVIYTHTHNTAAAEMSLVTSDYIHHHWHCNSIWFLDIDSHPKEKENCLFTLLYKRIKDKSRLLMFLFTSLLLHCNLQPFCLFAEKPLLTTSPTTITAVSKWS